VFECRNGTYSVVTSTNRAPDRPSSARQHPLPNRPVVSNSLSFRRDVERLAVLCWLKCNRWPRQWIGNIGLSGSHHRITGRTGSSTESAETTVANSNVMPALPLAANGHAAWSDLGQIFIGPIAARKSPLS